MVHKTSLFTAQRAWIKMALAWIVSLSSCLTILRKSLRLIFAYQVQVQVYSAIYRQTLTASLGCLSVRATTGAKPPKHPHARPKHEKTRRATPQQATTRRRRITAHMHKVQASSGEAPCSKPQMYKLARAKRPAASQPPDAERCALHTGGRGCRAKHSAHVGTIQPTNVEDVRRSGS